MKIKNTSRPLRLATAAAAVLLLATGCSAGTQQAGTTPSTVNLDAAAPTPPEGVAEFRQAEPGSGEGLTIGFTQLILAAPFPQAVQASIEEQMPARRGRAGHLRLQARRRHRARLRPPVRHPGGRRAHHVPGRRERRPEHLRGRPPCARLRGRHRAGPLPSLRSSVRPTTTPAR